MSDRKKRKASPRKLGRSKPGSVQQNAQGGVHVEASELKQAFQFFDEGDKGFITLADLKKRLGVFYQNLSLKEYKFLMNNKQELTEQELYALLAHNELGNFDPVAEAFRIYDPDNTGYMDINVFRDILRNLGFGDITDQDVQTLVDAADKDGDGRLGLEDFREMLQTLEDASVSQSM
jgi:calmodulin